MGVANVEILFTGNPDPMYVYDRKTLQFLEVNDAALKKYGYTRDEFLRMKITDIRPAEDVPLLLASLRKNTKPLSSRGCWRHRRKDGQIFDVEITTQRLCFEGHDAHLAVLQDVSARRAAERKAAEHNAYLHAVMDNNPLAVVALDAHRRIQMCNPAFERMFGYRLAEIRDRRLEERMVTPGRESIAISFMERAMAGEVMRITVQAPRRDGSLVDVRILGVPLVINGERRGTFALYEDITEQVRAEEARRQAEEKYQRIVDNAVEGIFESIPGYCLVAVNPALARIAGYASPAEMISSIANLSQLYADPREQQTLDRILKERGFIEGFECQMLRKDGSTIWISLNVRETPGEDGKPTMRDGTVVEITARKRSELERQVTTEIIRSVTVTDNLDDLLRLIHAALKRVIDAENCFVALRDPATGLFSCPFFVDKFDEPSPPQEMGRSCTSYVFRTGQPLLLSPERFSDLVASGEVEQIGTVCCSWLGVPLRTPAATIGVLVVQQYEREKAYTERDLEFLSSVGGQIALAIERKRAEEKMREGEARIRLLIDRLPAVLSMVDRNLRFTSVLGADLARMGIAPEQLVGKSMFEYFETSDETFAPIAAHRRAIAGEPVTYQVEWKGGAYACHVEPLRDSEGEVQGAICLALDVTDRKRLEEQFRQAQKMEAVGRLAGGIAHDFNNLLMVIQGYADMLTERLPAGDSMRRSAEQIQTAAQRAASLTRQLLAFSRKQMLAPTVLNIQAVVTEMEGMLRRLIGEDIDLNVSSAPELWPVKADRSQVEQVVMNLVVNARDAMPNGGRLTIETANVEMGVTSKGADALPPGEYVMLAVTDNGAGMDHQTQAHIFEPFFTTKEKGKGTGLGLATVYGIVKQSGGYVWVYSEPGRGSTFKVYLPRTKDALVAASPDRGKDTASLPRGSEVVLLVEDEKGVRDLAREYLETIGYQVLEAENSYIALEMAAMHSGPIHLLLTDVVMPGIGGRELSARIAAIRPDIKILYMSGYADHAVVHQDILSRDATLLQKPFTLATLAVKLREVLAVEAVQ
ncbi:MAG: PAS domain S-box protein [Acidobacteriia bacterium]|nr:PAS domain S-box protein [Terriglobia bacterium]